MNVREFIAELQKLDPDMGVVKACFEYNEVSRINPEDMWCYLEDVKVFDNFSFYPETYQNSLGQTVFTLS
jgi:hypothetical protein